MQNYTNIYTHIRINNNSDAHAQILIIMSRYQWPLKRCQATSLVLKIAIKIEIQSIYENKQNYCWFKAKGLIVNKAFISD